MFVFKYVKVEGPATAKLDGQATLSLSVLHNGAERGENVLEGWSKMPVSDFFRATRNVF